MATSAHTGKPFAHGESSGSNFHGAASVTAESPSTITCIPGALPDAVDALDIALAVGPLVVSAKPKTERPAQRARSSFSFTQRDYHQHKTPGTKIQEQKLA
jgi:hypothetical protein